MSLTLQEMADAQDTLDASIKDLVSTFLTNFPNATFSNANVYMNTINGVQIPTVSTIVEADIDGAHITRRTPANS